MPTFHFTNPNGFPVYVYAVDSGGHLGMGYLCDTARGGQNTLVQNWPEGTELRFGAPQTGGPMVFDSYKTTKEDIQNHTIRNVSISVSIHNNTKSDVFLFTVDPSGQEQSQGSMMPGTWSSFPDAKGALKPSTTWRIKDAAGTVLNTYVTNADRYQTILAIPEVSILPEVTPVVITGGTVIYSGPIANQPLDPKTHTPPIEVWSAQRSIFNAASYTLDVGMFEWSIRQRTNLLGANADKNAIRAALYAGLMAIATATSQTDKEKAIMGWLADQIKKARISAAQLALREYYRWNADPWSYNPPAGFAPYLLTPKDSPEWLTGATQRWLHKFGRCGKWNFRLTAGTLVLANQEQR